jgi:hypothetical protein
MKPGRWYTWVYGSDARLYVPRGIRPDSDIGRRLRLLSAKSHRRLYGLGLPPEPDSSFFNIELLASMVMIGMFWLSVGQNPWLVFLLGGVCVFILGRRRDTEVYEITLNQQSPGGTVRYLSSGEDYNANFQLLSKMPEVREIDLSLNYSLFGPDRSWGVIVTTDIGPLLLCAAEDPEAAQK